MIKENPAIADRVMQNARGTLTPKGTRALGTLPRYRIYFAAIGIQPRQIDAKRPAFTSVASRRAMVAVK